MMAIVMGVSGCGKTTVGRLLARELGCEFLDADDFHPEANVAKMAKRRRIDRRRSLAMARRDRRGDARTCRARSRAR